MATVWAVAQVCYQIWRESVTLAMEIGPQEAAPDQLMVDAEQLHAKLSNSRAEEWEGRYKKQAERWVKG